jgi:hypothetical protein
MRGPTKTPVESKTRGLLVRGGGVAGTVTSAHGCASSSECWVILNEVGPEGLIHVRDASTREDIAGETTVYAG